MGHKVNPIGLRLGINRTWDSRWFADEDYARLLHEDIKLRSHLRRRLSGAFRSGVATPRRVHDDVVHRPGDVADHGVAPHPERLDVADDRRNRLGALVERDDETEGYGGHGGVDYTSSLRPTPARTRPPCSDVAQRRRRRCRVSGQGAGGLAHPRCPTRLACEPVSFAARSSMRGGRCRSRSASSPSCRLPLLR